MREFLLAADDDRGRELASRTWAGPASGTLIALEGHGRADDGLDTDTTNTVGWFTTAFPVRLGVGTAAVDLERPMADPEARRALLDSVGPISVQSRMKDWTMGCSVMSTASPSCSEAAEPQIQFGYMGAWTSVGQRLNVVTAHRAVCRRAPDRSRTRSAAALRAEHQRARGCDTRGPATDRQLAVE